MHFVSSNEIWDSFYEKNPRTNIPRGKNEIYLKKDNCDLNINHYCTGSGINYLCTIGNFKEDTIVENIEANNFSFISFNPSTSIHMRDTRKNQDTKWNSNICLIGETNKGHRSSAIYNKNKQSIIHSIAIENTLFSQLKEGKAINKLNKVYKSDYIDVSINNYISNRQKNLLDDLLKLSTLNDSLKMLYLESKILDLIHTTLSSCQMTPKLPETIALSPKDIECLNKAKDILLSDISNPPSLKELAHKSALNEFKLKKGFKKLFGNTVFGLLQEYRLNEAKKLLESNDINVSEASFLVGYKGSSHFSKVFKEQFGISPNIIRQETKKYYYSR